MNTIIESSWASLLACVMLVACSKGSADRVQGQGGEAGVSGNAGSAGNDEQAGSSGSAGASGEAGASENAGSAGSAGQAGQGGEEPEVGGSAAGGRSPTLSDSPEPVGVYVDDQDVSQHVTESEWVSGQSVFTFEQFEPDSDFAIAKNSADNPDNPGLFTRIDWTSDSDEQLYFCLTVNDASDLSSAIRTPRADVTSLESGCHGDAFDALHLPSIVGHYQDDYGATHYISNQTWIISGQGDTDSEFALVELSNQNRWLLGHNDALNEYSPDLYSRFDWTVDEDGGLWYCQTTYDAESLDAARDTEPADPNDLETGCSGFPWSSMTEI